VKIRPIHPHAAILLEDAGRKYITVSDLHIGLEAELLAKGITVSSTLVSDMIAELSDLVQSEHADKCARFLETALDQGRCISCAWQS
jgi:metallophosphoesterase superfamily enzyme